MGLVCTHIDKYIYIYKYKYRHSRAIIQWAKDSEKNIGHCLPNNVLLDSSEEMFYVLRLDRFTIVPLFSLGKRWPSANIICDQMRH